MKIIHITGPIGSGKTTLDLSLRNELGALNIKGEIVRKDDIFFVGRVHEIYGDNYKNELITFGGLDSYLGKNKHDINYLLNEIRKQEETNAKYCIMAGLKSFNKDIQKFNEYNFYEIISLRGAKRVLKQREKRRGYKKDEEEAERIKKEIDSYNNKINKWKNLEKQYSNVHLKVFNKSMLFTKRMEYVLKLINKPVRTKGHYKRKFF